MMHTLLLTSAAAHTVVVCATRLLLQVTAKDDYIKWTLTGVKPDTAKPPLRSLQVGWYSRRASHGVSDTSAWGCV
jgi:hypothetical protein